MDRIIKYILVLALIGLINPTEVGNDMHIYNRVDVVDTNEESPLITTLKNFKNNGFSKSFTSAIEEETPEYTTEYRRLLQSNASIINNSCENRKKEGTIADFYYFLPNLYGKLFAQNTKIEFESNCFKTNTFSLVQLTDSEAHFELEASEPKGFFCNDFHLLTTSRIQHTVDVFFRGKHKIVLKNLTENDLAEIKLNGFRLLGFCQNVIESLTSLYETARMYLGGFSTKHAHVNHAMEIKNIDFIKRYVGLEYVPRGDISKKVLNIDKSNIKTGDFVAIVRLDGLDQMIQMGTGSSIGHTAVCAWIDGELNVIESQDGWYWPKHGIQRNNFDVWLENAFNADFHVVIVPLKEEIRKKLNVEKALDWFKKVEGLNYGYHNFLFSWLDTLKNLPEYFDYEVLMPLLAIFDKISKDTFNLIIGEALNKRVGTKGLDLPNVIAKAADQGLSFEDLVNIPEMQGWEYSDGENYVCSCFCAGFYKAGGLFGDLDIQPQEFTPKDIYQLSFFDSNYVKPQECEAADPGTPFCQLMGKYRVIFRGVGTIEPYTKMNERCESQGPNFIRNSGC